MTSKTIQTSLILLLTLIASHSSNKAPPTTDEHSPLTPQEIQKLEIENEPLRLQLIQTHLQDNSKTWTQQEFLPVALQFFIKETYETIWALQVKSNSEKLTDHEQGILSSAHIIEHYLEKSYNSQAYITSNECAELLSFTSYEQYGNEHADEIIDRLEKHSPGKYLEDYDQHDSTYLDDLENELDDTDSELDLNTDWEDYEDL